MLLVLLTGLPIVSGCGKETPHHPNSEDLVTASEIVLRSCGDYEDCSGFSLALNSNGDIFIGCCFGGIFRSTDDGETWEQISAGLGDHCINGDFAMCGSGLMFVSSYSGGIYRSDDNGGSWEAVEGFTSSLGFTMLAVDSNDNIFAGSYSNGVYRSTDYGETWQSISEGLDDIGISAMIVDDQDRLVVCTFSNDEVFISSTAGTSWERAQTGPTGGSVTSFSEDDNGIIYAIVLWEDIFESSDGGATWELVCNDPFGDYLKSLAFNSEGHMIAATSNSGIMVSRDHGLTWSFANAGIWWWHMRALVPGLADQQLYALTYHGILYRSDNDGSEWNQISTVFSRKAYRLAVTADGYVFAHTDAGILRSSDNGETWSTAHSGIEPGGVSCFLAHSRGFMLASVYYNEESNNIYRSSDYGASWEKVGAGLTNLATISLTESITGNIYAGTRGGVFVSRDNGDTWRSACNELVDSPIVSVEATARGFVFAFAVDSPLDEAGLYRLHEWEGIWRKVQFFENVRFAGLASLSDGTVFAGKPGGLYRSYDNGDTWELISDEISFLKITAITSNSAGHIFLDTHFSLSGGTYRSIDKGDTWESIEGGIPADTYFNDMIVTPDDYLFVASFRGILRSIDPTIE